jgi:hypothetical protein
MQRQQHLQINSGDFSSTTATATAIHMRVWGTDEHGRLVPPPPPPPTTCQPATCTASGLLASPLLWALVVIGPGACGEGGSDPTRARCDVRPANPQTTSGGFREHTYTYGAYRLLRFWSVQDVQVCLHETERAGTDWAGWLKRAVTRLAPGFREDDCAMDRCDGALSNRQTQPPSLLLATPYATRRGQNHQTCPAHPTAAEAGSIYICPQLLSAACSVV